MIDDEKRVTDLMTKIGLELNPHLAPICWSFPTQQSNISVEELIRFEKEVMKRAGLEVLALREFATDCATSWDCDTDAHKYGTICRQCAAKEAIENSEASANRIKAGIEADVLEEAELVSYEYFMHGLDARDVAAELNRLAEERRTIAKGEE